MFSPIRKQLYNLSVYSISSASYIIKSCIDVSALLIECQKSYDVPNFSIGFSAKTATGTVAIQVEDYNDHCPILNSTVTRLCYGSSVVYVSATDGDTFPNAEPFNFILASKGTKEKWSVEHING